MPNGPGDALAEESVRRWPISPGHQCYALRQQKMWLIFADWVANKFSEAKMGNVTSGQSINHGDNKVTGHSVWDPMQASSGGPSDMGNCQVGWLV